MHDEHTFYGGKLQSVMQMKIKNSGWINQLIRN